jgi:hypothetical protein
MLNQTTQYENFTQGLASGDVEEWEHMNLVWEANPTNTSPYDSSYSGVSMIQADVCARVVTNVYFLAPTSADVHLKLIEAEHVEHQHSETTLHDKSASTFLVTGLELEDTQ